MNFTVQHIGQAGRKYKISTGDGSPVHVATLSAVNTAMAHYFGEKHNRTTCSFCSFVRRSASKKRS